MTVLGLKSLIHNASNPPSESDSSVDSPKSLNILDVTKVGAAAIRYGVSNRATAAISTATFAAVKDAGWLNTEVQNIDHYKIMRYETKLMKEPQQHSSKLIKETKVLGILFDGRKEETKFVKKGDDGKFHPDVIKDIFVFLALWGPPLPFDH